MEKKVYYEILEFEGELLKNIYSYAHNDVLISKRNAERYYSIKVRQAEQNNKPLIFKLVLIILDDYQPTRYFLNDNDPQARQLEAMILSAISGQQIEIPEWPIREAQMLEEFV